MGEVDPIYLQNLERTAVGAVAAALRRMEPVHLGIGQGTVPGLAIIREGPGEGQPYYPPEAKILKIVRASTGEPLAILLNYTCHPVILSGYTLTADYPGAARRFVQRNLRVPLLFLQGACGDVNPVWRKPMGATDIPNPVSDEVERFGRALGAEVVKLAELTPTGEQSGLWSVCDGIPLPTAPPDREELAAIIEQADKFEQSEETRTGSFGMRKLMGISRMWAMEMLDLLHSGSFPATVECPAQLLRVGDALLVGVGAEVFSEIGIAARRILGTDHTFFAGYTDGCIGYIPSAEAYDAAPYGTRESVQWYGIPRLARDAEHTLLHHIQRIAQECGWEGAHR
jgi:hypothetical protein